MDPKTSFNQCFLVDLEHMFKMSLEHRGTFDQHDQTQKDELSSICGAFYWDE